jgi:hypothetical protein
VIGAVAVIGLVTYNSKYKRKSQTFKWKFQYNLKT